MNAFRIRLCLLAIGLVLFALPGWANDQSVVIGIGIGSHSFADTDDARQDNPTVPGDGEISSAALSQVYVEWYALGDVGFGFRRVVYTGGRTTSNSSFDLDQEITVSNNFLTVTYVADGSTSYTRFGLQAGVGSSEYEAREKYSDYTGTTQGYDESWSASGSASLLGAYVDWGADGFGARFGIQYIGTDLDTLVVPAGNLEVDGSGTSLYIDLRWAFN